MRKKSHGTRFETPPSGRLALALALGLVAACEPQADLPALETSSADLMDNGMPTNGMPTNGMPTNGMPTNGLQANGLPTSGLQSNGIPATGLQNSAAFNNWFHWFAGCTSSD